MYRRKNFGGILRIVACDARPKVTYRRLKTGGLDWSEARMIGRYVWDRRNKEARRLKVVLGR